MLSTLCSVNLTSHKSRPQYSSVLGPGTISLEEKSGGWGGGGVDLSHRYRYNYITIWIYNSVISGNVQLCVNIYAHCPQVMFLC